MSQDTSPAWARIIHHPGDSESSGLLPTSHAGDVRCERCPSSEVERALEELRDQLWAAVQTECDNGKATAMPGYAEGIRDAAGIIRRPRPVDAPIVGSHDEPDSWALAIANRDDLPASYKLTVLVDAVTAARARVRELEAEL